MPGLGRVFGLALAQDLRAMMGLGTSVWSLACLTPGPASLTRGESWRGDDEEKAQVGPGEGPGEPGLLPLPRPSSLLTSGQRSLCLGP